MSSLYHEKVSSLHGVSVHTGFPNPAIDASLKDLDLNTLLVSHSAATYYMQIVGDGWKELGIFSGDIALVDRAVTAYANDIVVWWGGDEFVFSNLHAVPKGAVVWGVVTSTIHRFKELN